MTTQIPLAENRRNRAPRRARGAAGYAAALFLLLGPIAPAGFAQLFTSGNQFLAPAQSGVFSAGFALASGDFDGDGFGDLAVGEPTATVDGANLAGRVQVWLGSPTGLRAPVTLAQGQGGLPGAAEPGDYFGLALAAGDFDHDGFDDLAVGVPLETITVDSDTISKAGAIELIYGSSTGLDSSRARILNQESAGVPGVAEAEDFFGAGLVAADFDGDDFADLAIGAPGEDVGNRADAGETWILFGSPTGLPGAGSLSFDEADAGGTVAAGNQFGAVLAAGDFDADGLADLAAGVPNATVGGQVAAGVVWVFSGTAAGIALPGVRLFQGRILGSGTVAGEAEAGDRFGWSLAAADFDRVNGQSPRYQDLAIGVPFENDLVGAVEILAGSVSGLSAAGSYLFFESDLPGASATSHDFGTAVAAGPLHSAVRGDLVVGVPDDPAGGEAGAGRVFVIAGSATGLKLGSASEWDAARAGLACGPPTPYEAFGAAFALGNFDGTEVQDLAIGVTGFDPLGFRDSRGGVEVLYGALFASDFETHNLSQWTSSAP